MKEQNAFETLKNTLEDKYIRRKVVKITQYASGHKVTLDKPIKVKNNLVTSWYFLNIMAYDVRLGDTMRFELTRKGLYFAGIAEKQSRTEKAIVRYLQNIRKGFKFNRRQKNERNIEYRGKRRV